MQLFCVYFALFPLHTANLNAIKATGHSGIFLKLEIIKKALETAVLLFTMRYGVMAITLGLVFSGFVSVVINAWPNRRLLDYPLIQQFRDALPAILLSCVMGLAILPVTWLKLHDLVKLIIMVPAGMAIYLGLSMLFKVDSFQYLLSALGKLRRRGG